MNIKHTTIDTLTVSNILFKRVPVDTIIKVLDVGPVVELQKEGILLTFSLLNGAALTVSKVMSNGKIQRYVNHSLFSHPEFKQKYMS